MSSPKIAPLLLALLLAGICVQHAAADDDGSEQDEARQAVESGAVRPLGEILPLPALRAAGEIVRVQLKREHGRWVYELRSVDANGSLHEFSVDAASGADAKWGRRLMRVLLVEDDDAIARDVERSLRSSGYVVERVTDGEEAWFRGDTEDYVAAVLDLGLPHMDGLSVLKRWRENGRRLPVLVLTARGSWSEKVEGIDAGADDYLAKPFRMEELLARLRSVIRRSAGHASSLATVGGLTLDERAMRVRLNGIPVDLSPMEYRLIVYLMLRRGHVVSQQELIENIYGDDEQSSNAVEVLVGRLRRKIGGEWIEMRRGFGYLIPESTM